MIQVPSNKPHVPASVAKEGASKAAEIQEKQAQQTAKELNKPAAPKLTNIGRGPEMDGQAIAVRLAAMATEAKELEKAREFKEILDKVVELTGLAEPEAAMEEANKRLQREIETEIERIKGAKDLMDEAKDWQNFGDLLASMGEEQAELVLGMIKDSVRELQ